MLLFYLSPFAVAGGAEEAFGGSAVAGVASISEAGRPGARYEFRPTG